MRLKKSLRDLVNYGRPPKPAPRKNFSDDVPIREQIQARLELPLSKFCSTKPDFDGRHGLVYKMLKTDVNRVKNGVLTAHDMMAWLRQGKPVPALWIVKLAGPKYGQIPRNQLLQWLRDNGREAEAASVLNWTKKWGIKQDSRALLLATNPKTVQEARIKYREADLPASDRQKFSNALLQKVVGLDPDEVFAFYKTLNKDIYTFQIMFAGMVKNKPLRKYRDQVWTTAQKHADAKNIVIDDKLRETYEISR